MPPTIPNAPFSPLPAPEKKPVLKYTLYILAALLLVGVGVAAAFYLPALEKRPSETDPAPVTTASTSTTTTGSLQTSTIILVSNGEILAIKPDVLATGSGATGQCQITNDSGGFYPSWSYDGKKIVYATQTSAGMFGIATIHADGTNRRTLSTSIVGAPLPSFSPDGTKIVYGDRTPGFESGAEVWTMNADGTNLQQMTKTTKSATPRDRKLPPGVPKITSVTWSKFPSYSPDGKKIVYSSTQSGNSEIWVMDADGENKTQLTFPTIPTAPDANAPAWSPDGSKIVFWSGYETEYGQLWMMNADGTGRTQLTFEPDHINSDDPNWTPDGKSIIYDSNRPESYANWTHTPATAQTWIMDADGGNQRVLTFTYKGFQVSRRPWRTDPVQNGGATFQCAQTVLSST